MDFLEIIVHNVSGSLDRFTQEPVLLQVISAISMEHWQLHLIAHHYDPSSL